MPIFIQSNIPSIRAQRNLGVAQRALNATLERLATGKRINRASDDPAGLLLSSRLTTSIQAWSTGADNLRLGLDLLNTADSFMTIVNDNLLRLNELANQAMNGLLSDDERSLLDQEFKEIIPEIQRLTQNTTFLGQTLFVGLSVSVVAGDGVSNVVTVMINNYRRRGKRALDHQLKYRFPRCGVTGVGRALCKSVPSVDIRYRSDRCSGSSVYQEYRCN